MTTPSYEDFIGNKKLTLAQHKRQRKKYEERYGVKISASGKVEKPKDESGKETFVKRSGRCEECDNGSFKMKVENGVFTRTCKECGNEKIV